jgi:hypothetical protein
MTTVRAASFQDGPRVTVNSLVKAPTTIPAIIIKDLSQEFIVDFLLRKLQRTTSGVYEYRESTPLFADGDAAIVEEFGEIPLITGKVGARKVAFTVKRALGLLVSREMRDRNDMDTFNTQVKQVRNTMVRTWETAFLQALLGHPDILSVTAADEWNTTTSDIRGDLMAGTTLIENAAPADNLDNYFGFEPDTLVIGRTTRNDLIESDDFNASMDASGPLADQNTLYTGQLPGKFFNVDKIMVSREMDRLYPGKAVLLQAKTVGGIGDERPLYSTPLKYDDDHETYRTNTGRRSAVVIDQPKAACIINGVR